MRCWMRCAARLGPALGTSQVTRRRAGAARGGGAARPGGERGGRGRADGRPLAEYQQILRDALGCQLLRLNDAQDGEDSPLDRLPDGAPDPEGVALEASRRRALAAAIGELPERERLVLSLYYEQELNLKEIGAVLKVSESRVCQLHGQALLRLKSRLVDWYS